MGLIDPRRLGSDRRAVIWTGDDTTYKYIRDSRAGTETVFDMVRDSLETVNRLDSLTPASRDTLIKLFESVFAGDRVR